MNREKRTIFLVVLTLLAYGFSIFKDQGSFILPFPIFDFILIIIAIQFAFWKMVFLFLLPCHFIQVIDQSNFMERYS